MLKSRARPRVPRQARSRRTQERLLDALESLLEEREVAHVTVDDIAERAHVSVGAFYKRFASKQDLLPLLLARTQASSRRQLEDELRESRWQGRGLVERIGAIVDMIAEAQIRRRRLIAAFVSGRFTATLQMSPQDIVDARATMDTMRNWLLTCRQEIHHDRPEAAVRIGLYLCLQSLQTALLFETLPPEVSREALVEETKRMLSRYLIGP